MITINMCKRAFSFPDRLSVPLKETCILYQLFIIAAALEQDKDATARGGAREESYTDIINGREMPDAICVRPRARGSFLLLLFGKKLQLHKHYCLMGP